MFFLLRENTEFHVHIWQVKCHYINEKLRCTDSVGQCVFLQGIEIEIDMC